MKSHFTIISSILYGLYYQPSNNPSSFHFSDTSVCNPLLIFLDKGFVLLDHIYLSLSKPETPSDKHSPSVEIQVEKDEVAFICSYSIALTGEI